MNESCNKPNKKLLIILGAGSSIPYRMPSVACINKHMLDWSKEWESSDKIYRGKNIFADLMDDNSNYELVLGQMTTLIYVLSQQISGIRLFENIKNQLPKILSNIDYSGGIESLRNIIIGQHRYLIEKLTCYFRTCCKKHSLPDVSKFSRFLQELRNHFEVGIYNLNHDNIAIRAWPEAFKGFTPVDSKQSSCQQINENYFDPMGIFNHKKWNFIYHLHGSVHFNFSNENAVKRTLIKWEENLFEDKFLDYFVPIAAQDDMSMHLPFTTLITGGSKLEQLLPEPYHTFHASLARHSHEADAILIAGYSFGDLHVNRALKNRFDISVSENQIFEPNCLLKTLPKVVILQKNCRDKPHTGIARPDWARQMYKTFNTPFSVSPDENNDNRTIGDVSTCDDFEEISSQIVICHKGTEDAFLDVKRVISKLI